MTARLAAAAFLSALALTACGGEGPSESTDQPVTEPRTGWVKVSDDPRVWKSCDGATLMYVLSPGAYGAGMSVVPNSPECAKP